MSKEAITEEEVIEVSYLLPVELGAAIAADRHELATMYIQRLERDYKPPSKEEHIGMAKLVRDLLKERDEKAHATEIVSADLAEKKAALNHIWQLTVNTLKDRREGDV